ncbi:hypothetical protein SLA2020_112080 [Shorea laevis]
MASSIAPVSISGGSHVKAREVWSAKSNKLAKTSSLAVGRKSNQLPSNRKFAVCAEYRDSNRGGGSDFVAGFLLGGAVFGTLAYTFAPQIRRALLNEDEYGFRRPKRPAYYDEGLDEGLEKTRQTLNEKITQLSSAIDNISSRLRGGNNSPKISRKTDLEGSLEKDSADATQAYI